MYLLDTNVCIQFLNQRSQVLIDRMSREDPGNIYLCSIVKAELYYGAYKSRNPEQALKVQMKFCKNFKSLSFGDKEANVYGEIRSELEKKGEIIGPNDLIIASIAAANHLILVTHNKREFERVSGLAIEDWQEIEK